jgi:hypothetical protein
MCSFGVSNEPEDPALILKNLTDFFVDVQGLSLRTPYKKAATK